MQKRKNLKLLEKRLYNIKSISVIIQMEEIFKNQKFSPFNNSTLKDKFFIIKQNENWIN